jgi:hypothetical protein
MTQTEYVHQCLNVFGSINTRDAKKVGIERLASRIKDLRYLGVPIITKRRQVSTRWGNLKTYVAEYHIESSL